MSTIARKQPKPQPLQYGQGSITYRAADQRYIVRVREAGTYRQIGSVKLSATIDDATAQQQARQILEDYHQDLKDGLDLSGRDWLTVDWLEHCLTAKEPKYDRRGNLLKGVEPTTFEKYEAQQRLHIVPYVGPILPPELVNVRRPHVQRWFDTLVDSGELGAGALNDVLTRLSASLQLAEDYDYIRKNPCRGIKRAKLPERQPVNASELDLVRLIRAIAGDPLEALVWVAMGSGLRRAEVGALKWADFVIFSPEHGQIRAHSRRNQIGRRTQKRFNLPSDLERSGTKSRAERTVDIGATVIAILEQRWQHQLADRITAGRAWKGTDSDTPDGYVFTTRVGTKLPINLINKYMLRTRKRAGLDLERFHALRHVFATLLNKAGVPDRVTQELGGWADLKMTHYYQDPMASQKRDASQALDGVLRELLQAAND